MKKISILGSTGSIGTQSLDIIRRSNGEYKAVVLSCAGRIKELCQQIEEFRPEMAVTATEEGALEVKKFLEEKGIKGTEIAWGEEGLVAAAAHESADTVINSLMGMRGLVPTYTAIKRGKNVALANKETLVAGGRIVMDAAKESGGTLLPIDSEHSAIFQCLQGNPANRLNRILLTASGGPFRGYSLEQLENVTLAQALKHPQWSMGAKITIDSATLMNKGLEVIEAKWLFDVEPDNIQVVVHPQSIIHSMVEYTDRSVIAQLGLPDMRVPIGYALSYPDRAVNDFPSLDLFNLKGGLTFEEADTKTFKCLQFAYDALRIGGSMPCAVNSANEELVAAFLEEKIRFIDIQNTIEKIMDWHDVQSNLEIEDVLAIDKQVRAKTRQIIGLKGDN